MTARRSTARKTTRTTSKRAPAPPTVEEAASRLGIEALRPEQEEVIAESLAGSDALMIVPTGFGKSACYQIPSMILPKPTVLISPLLSLLEDQEQKLQSRDIPCYRLDGTVRGKKRRETLERIAAGGSLLVMTTPETLAGPELSQLLEKTGVGLVAVDEAHCISEWGYDFRPAYRRIGAELKALGSPPLLALTATATEHVRDAIVQSLGMRDPHVTAVSPHRSNLAFEVLSCEGDVRARVLVRLVRRLRRPGIIYCATRREVDMLWALLKRFRIPAHRYHGGMTATERNTEQARFMRRGHRTVMVATNAFGLGIDKPDIRYVLHYQSPASLEQYVQEAGRGGRDGKKSNCILLHDPADRSIHEALLARSRIRPEQLFKLGAALAAWHDEERSPSLEALALSAELGPRITQALLAKIEEAGFVTVEDSTIHVTDPARSIEEDTRSLAGQFERLKREDSRRLDTIDEYATAAHECRAVFLRRYFGEDDDDDDEEPCDLCDVCRGRPKRPTGFFAPLAAPKVPQRKSRAKRGGRRRSRGRSARPAARGGEESAAKAGDGAAAKAEGRAGEGRSSRPGQRRSRRRRSRRRPRTGSGRGPRSEGGPPSQDD
ncbi:MAG: RecQ family ATP-dependent DNA helicase [Myxococcota bacterium]|nr:RecQ family ATP-dependent DNA helicase [Myxococcota bacterium]